jgi:hypothetical protein
MHPFGSDVHPGRDSFLYRRCKSSVGGITTKLSTKKILTIAFISMFVATSVFVMVSTPQADEDTDASNRKKTSGEISVYVQFINLTDTPSYLKLKFSDDL